jgi:hypothetical protein
MMTELMQWKETMIHKSKSTHQSNIQLEYDSLNCRKRRIGDTCMVECLMGETGCQWAMLIEDAHYCKHPSAKRPLKLTVTDIFVKCTNYEHT